MKNILIIIIGIIICIYSCRMPEDPLGDIKIIKRLDTIDTRGDCLDLDVDIVDSILVASANYNGYFIYEIDYTGEIISGITERMHISTNEMDVSIGDNRAQSVVLSQNHNIALVMDRYDHIWLYKYEDGAIQYNLPNYLEEDCYGGTWLSVAIDDQPERIGIYTLVKHNAAEDSVGAFLEYSTSLIWTNLKGVDPMSNSTEQINPNCEYIINQGSIAEKISFNDGLLSMTYGELGVRVFEQTVNNLCLTDTGFIDLTELEATCSDHQVANSDEINYKSCCENSTCLAGIGQCDWFTEGYGGVFSSEGGIIPEVYAEFDTPGEVESIYSYNKTIFAGLKYSNGCLIVKLDENGDVKTNQHIASGFSVNGIHQNNGLLALSVGHDGILLYDLTELDATFLGKIETSYANNVKVSNNIVFAATEDGIEIIQIEY